MHKDSSPSAIELAADVESLFFARSEGEIYDEALKLELLRLLDAQIVISLNIRIDVDRVSVAHLPASASSSVQVPQIQVVLPA